MYFAREAVSAETIQRAIRARLAIAYGANSPYVILPLPIQEIPPGDDGVNWQLSLDSQTASDAGIEAARHAAADVAGTFNVGRAYH
ncbi:MAG: hypothetical protein JWQ90_2876 [Hydrocarboniphaga sp.]|uniref:hypothetical protein n=1 Tax=Hydrocarboniphaga sp. TaxID=2033016 RepID=UPI00262667F9|nr:hypothetical protein [Hydrocarboniphaga sp.]MDB5970426.1 hypothetical protein [Hydrocarboniphaga sp.]